jgi:hypothetical protein
LIELVEIRLDRLGAPLIELVEIRLDRLDDRSRDGRIEV